MKLFLTLICYLQFQKSFQRLFQLESMPGGGYDLTKLSLTQFKETLNEDSVNWFILFYADWCQYCKTLIPEWQKVATELSRTKVKIGLMECSNQNQNCLLLNLQGYPTMMYFSNGIMYEYKEERTADEFMFFALDGWKDAKGEKIPDRILGFFEGMIKNVGWVVILLFLFCTLVGLIGIIALCKDILSDGDEKQQNSTEESKKTKNE